MIGRLFIEAEAGEMREGGTEGFRVKGAVAGKTQTEGQSRKGEAVFT